MFEQNDKNLSFLPVTAATNPANGMYRCIKDSWWIAHPDKGLIFYRKHSPQCNANEEIARRLKEKLYPWAEVVHMPFVFVESDQNC